MSTAVHNNKQDTHALPDSVNVSQAINLNEKDAMQVIEKLYLQNVKLSKEFGTLSEQLPALLEKEKEAEKGKKQLSGSQIGVSDDNPLQRELAEAYKQMQAYQKEVKSLKNKYGSSATYERYTVAENKNTLKEKELEKMMIEKALIERTIMERELAIETLKQQTGNDVKIPLMKEELKKLKETLKQAAAYESKLEAEANKDNAEISKQKEELGKVKEVYRYMLERTGYDPVEDKVRPKPVANPLYKRNQSKNDRVIARKVQEEDETEDLECDEANFEKLYSAVRALRKSEADKDRDYRLELQRLKSRLESLKKGQEEMTKKYTEKEKEANILAIKLRELHRIARYHSLLPLEDQDSPVNNLQSPKKSQLAPLKSPLKSPSSAGKLGLSSPSGKLGVSSPSGKLGASSPSGNFSMKNKLARLDSLNDLAKKGHLYAGYRKDERGKVMTDGPGEHVGDKDHMGSTKPKIIGLKIWHDNRRLTGFQATYKTEDGTISEGGLHGKNPHAYKLESFELSGEDYLKEISGFTNKAENLIECLMLMSAKGETKKILEPTKESKLFKFDINEFEYPSVLYGYLKEEEPRNYLTKLGVLIASNNVEENLKTASDHGEEKRA